MKIIRTAAALVALGSLAALPACSSVNKINPFSSQTSSVAPSAAMPAAVSPDLVKKVQTSLANVGTYKGPVDGVWGPATQGAVRSYQGAHNLTANGQLDTPTLTALDITHDASMDAGDGQATMTPGAMTPGTMTPATTTPGSTTPGSAAVGAPSPAAPGAMTPSTTGTTPAQ